MQHLSTVLATNPKSVSSNSIQDIIISIAELY